MEKEELGTNPKIHASAVGGGSGLAIGIFASELFAYYALDAATPPGIVLAWRALFEFGLSVAGVYAGAYLKNDAPYQRARQARGLL